MNSFHEVVATQRYQPASARDCDPDQFSGRLAVCQGCSHRFNNQCTLARQIVSIQARRKSSLCPARKWPGEVPRPAIAAPGPAQRVSRLQPPRPAAALDIRPRVAIVLPHWWCGGVERQTLALIRHSRQAINWVGAWIGRGLIHQASLDELRTFVPTHDLTPSGVTEAVDLAMVWGFQSPQPWTRQLAGRLICASHGASNWNNQQLYVVSSGAIGGVAVSQVAFDNAPASLKSRMTIIPNGIELDRIAPTRARNEIRASLGIGHRQVVGYVGRISEEKNPLAAAAAVGELRKREGDCWLAVMCGPFSSADSEARYRHEAEQLNPGGNLWLSPPDHVGDVFAALDYKVLASPAEGSALVIAEAWAAGVPVVATNVGCIPEMEAKHGPMVWPISTRSTPDGVEIAEQILLARKSGTDLRTAKAQMIAWEECSAARMARNWVDFLQACACQVSRAQ